MKKKIVVAVSVFSLLASPVYASEYDVENMSQEELKEAVVQLESEKAELEGEVKDLKVQIFDLQQGDDSSAEIESEAEVVEETEAEKVPRTTDEFLTDIVDSYNRRGIVSDRYTVAELNTMDEDAYVQTYVDCVKEEEPFYEKYKNAIFDDLNIQYLCDTYCDGVKSQLDCCQKYQEDGDYDSWDKAWSAAYNKRSYVIIELSEYYEAPFEDVKDMKSNVESLDSLNEAETRNAEVDHSVVQKTQELLNTIGFFCGNADGISGKRTVKSIKRFQEMYGYEPVDGMIDEELISQLEEVAAQKMPVEETESETE